MLSIGWRSVGFVEEKSMKCCHRALLGALFALCVRVGLWVHSCSQIISLF